MDKKAAVRAYAIVIMLMVSVSGAAVAPFLAAMMSGDNSLDNKDPVECNNGQSGTTLTASKTATGHWAQVVKYDWGILKAVTPGEATIDEGMTADFTYNLTITRTSAVVSEEFYVDGVITVTNGGAVATEGLTITDVVKKKCGAGQFQDYMTVPIDISSNPVLDPGEVGNYPYKIVFTPEDGCQYKNEVQVRITNHSGHLGTPFGPSPDAGFTIPAAPTIEYEDEEADIQDVITAPGGGFVVQGDLIRSWHVTAPGYIEYTVTVKNEGATPDISVPMPNCATLTEEDTKVTRKSCAEVDLIGGELQQEPAPSMEIIKTGPEECQCICGGGIIWHVTITNTGNVDLEDIAVDDALTGDHFVIDLLKAYDEESEDDTYEFDTTLYHIPFDIKGDYVENTVTASAMYDGKEVFAQASHKVFICQPGFEVSKTADRETACVGDEIEWNITICNTGNMEITVHVHDAMLGIDEDVLLGVGECKYYELTTVVPGGVAEEFSMSVASIDLDDYITNTVTVTWNDVTKQASDSVFINKPDLDVEKTGPAEAEPGQDIMYLIQVWNTGNVELNVHLEDAQLQWTQDVVLAANGGYAEYYVPYTIPIDYVKDTFENTVTASARICSSMASDMDSWVVKIAYPDGKPCICIEKCGPVAAMPGETVPFWITVKNTGDVPLTNFDIYDYVAGLGYSDAIIEVPANLLPGGSFNMVIEWTIPVDWEEPYFVNVVEVRAQWFNGEENVNVWCLDSHAVKLIHPEISVCKSAPEKICEGSELIFTITVKNLGDVDLQNVVVTDTPEYGEPMQWIIEYLPVGAVEEIHYSIMVPEPFEGEDDCFCNHVEVNAVPGPSCLWCACGQECPWFEVTKMRRMVSDFADTCTFVVKPDIDVEKCGPEEAKIGEEIEYVITVTNTGNFALSNVVVEDAMLGYITTIPCLAKGESMTFKVPYMITGESPIREDDKGDWWLCNEVMASGFGLCKKVSDSDTHCTFIGNPHITIVKTAPEQVLCADRFIPYHLYVVNDGNIPLYDVTVTDEMFGLCWSWYIGTMMPGDEAMKDFCYPLPCDCKGGEFINTAIVTASDGTTDSDTIGGEDNVQTFVACPGIEITKIFEGSICGVGSTINWVVEVHNIGNVPLTNVWMNDTLVGLNLFVGDLGVGESVGLDVPYLVTEETLLLLNENDEICNVAFAEGYFQMNECRRLHVSDEAMDCVFVPMPEFSVEKVGPEMACYGSKVVYTITVTNLGNVPLYIHVVDDLTADVWDDYLEIGQSKQFITKEVTADIAGEMINQVGVCAGFARDCKPIHHDAMWTTFVGQPDIEVTKVGPKVAVVGEEITYFIYVENHGNVDVDVYLDDELLGMDDYIMGNVAAGEMISADFQYVVPCMEGTLVNEVQAVGIWPQFCGCCYDTDCAMAETFLMDESIKIIKTGPESAVPGELISFTFDVWNDGDVILDDVFVWDPMFDKYCLQSKWYLADDMNEEDGSLEAGEHWTFSVQFVIPENYLEVDPCGQLTNWACAHGYYHGVETMWGDGWAVWVHEPGCDEDDGQIPV